jgi:hypothetical protein
MTPSQLSRPQCGRVPYPLHSGRVAALDSGFRCVRRYTRQSAYVVTRTLPASFPPIPPASQNGLGTARTGRIGGHTSEIGHWVRAGSANNSWFPGDDVRKSLIVDSTTATNQSAFATSQARFATSRLFAACPAALLFSLSNLLKEKKKEGCEVQGIRHSRTPRVTPVLPSVRPAAYFLGHESDTRKTSDSWQLMASDSLSINELNAIVTSTTCPRVVLRVPPSRACSETP